MSVSSFSIDPRDYRKHVAVDDMQDVLADIEYAIRSDGFIPRQEGDGLPFRVKGNLKTSCLQVFGTSDDIVVESTEFGISSKLHPNSNGEYPYSDFEFIEVPKLWLNVARVNASIPIQDRSISDVIAMRSPHLLREMARHNHVNAGKILDQAIRSSLYSEYQKNLIKFDFAYHLGVKVKETFHSFLKSAEDMCRKDGDAFEGPYLAGALYNLVDKHHDSYPEMLDEVFDWRQRINATPAEEISSNSGLLFVPYDLAERYPSAVGDRVLELCDDGPAMDRVHENRIYLILMKAHEALPDHINERLVQEIQNRNPDFYDTVAYRLEEILNPSNDLLSEQTGKSASLSF